MPVAGTAPALADRTAGVEPAGEAEKAAAARPEARTFWAQDNARRGHEVETPQQTERELKAQLQDGQCKQEALPQKGEGEVYEPPPEALPPEGRRNLEAPPRKGKRKRGAMPQSNPNKGEHEPCWSLRDCAKTFCPLGKNQALRIQEGQPESKSSA